MIWFIVILVLTLIFFPTLVFGIVGWLFTSPLIGGAVVLGIIIGIFEAFKGPITFKD